MYIMVIAGGQGKDEEVYLYIQLFILLQISFLLKINQSILSNLRNSVFEWLFSYFTDAIVKELPYLGIASFMETVLV